MINFTSSLYLGLWHPSRSLPGWAKMTTGAPAALEDPPGAPAAARRLAHQQGCEGGVLASSTLHLFWDLFGQLSEERVCIYLEAGTYPIASWGVERAAARGMPVKVFSRRNVARLVSPNKSAAAHQKPLAAANHKPVVVTNGVDPYTGRPAPLQAYLDFIRPAGGLLVIDDTQALGLLGRRAGVYAPYGLGGGGILAWLGLSGPDILMVSSLAKSFGVSAAVLSGSQEQVERFSERSQTRLHCSPPSVAEVQAVENALALNERIGDQLRLLLAKRVIRFRDHMKRLGFTTGSGLFPVQVLRPRIGWDAAVAHRTLLAKGIRCVLMKGLDGPGARLGFLITARTRPDEIDRAAYALEGLVNDRAAGPGPVEAERLYGNGWTHPARKMVNNG